MLTQSRLPVNAAYPRGIPLEQTQLARSSRWLEAGRIQLVAAVQIQTVARAGHAKTLLPQLGEYALAAHARAETRVILTPAAHLPDLAHDMRRLERVMPLQPILEQVLQLVGQAQNLIARDACALRSRALQH